MEWNRWIERERRRDLRVVSADSIIPRLQRDRLDTRLAVCVCYRGGSLLYRSLSRTLSSMDTTQGGARGQAGLLVRICALLAAMGRVLLNW